MARDIIFDSIFLQDFASYSKRTEFDFPQEPGLYYLTGKNEVEPALGANGAGKSTFWEALVWCLYGRLSDDGKTADIVNIKTGARPYVRLGITINDVSQVVERFGTPNQLKLNGSAADQRTIDELIGLSRPRFLASVMFGQFAPMFYDLSIAERGELLDEALDLSIWEDCAELAGKRETTADRKAQELRTTQASQQARLSTLQDQRVALEVDEADYRHSQQIKINDAIAKVEQIETAMEATRLELAAARAVLAEFEAGGILVVVPALTAIEARMAVSEQELETARDALANAKRSDEVVIPVADKKLAARLDAAIEKRQDIDGKSRRAKTDLDFYRLHATCPTCQQSLSSDFVADEKARLQAIIEQAGKDYDLIMTEIADIRELIAAESAERDRVMGLRSAYEAEWRAMKAAVTRYETELQRDQHMIEQLKCEAYNEELHRRQKVIREYKVTLVLNQRAIADLEHQCAQFAADNPFTARLADVNARINEAADKLKTAKAGLQGCETDRRMASFWKAAFKRVRLFVIKRITDTLSMEATAAANGLGLIGWQINFTTEIETKSGTLKPGMQIEVLAPHDNKARRWSGGEAQRIRLATSLGLSSMLQRMAQVRVKLLVFDEPTQHLTLQGVNDLVQVLADLTASSGIPAWLIDHVAIDSISFRETWCVTKDVFGSKIARI